MTPTTPLGVNFPNRRLQPGELERMAACGFRSFVIYVSDLADLGYWAEQVRQLLFLLPGAQVHIRLESRGELTPYGDGATLVRAGQAFLSAATSYRIRNEPNIESPCATPNQWHHYLYDLGSFLRDHYDDLSEFYVPAISPSTPDALNWIQASTDAAKLCRFGGVDVHAYGTTAQIEAVVDEYRKVYGGCILLSEFNFGAGKNLISLANYARTIPDTLELLDQHAIEAACWFSWAWTDSPKLPTTVDVLNSPVETFLKTWRPTMTDTTSAPTAATATALADLQKQIANLAGEVATLKNQNAILTQAWTHFRQGRFSGAGSIDADILAMKGTQDLGFVPSYPPKA